MRYAAGVFGRIVAFFAAVAALLLTAKAASAQAPRDPCETIYTFGAAPESFALFYELRETEDAQESYDAMVQAYDHGYLGGALEDARVVAEAERRCNGDGSGGVRSARHNIGVILTALGRYDEAATELDAALAPGASADATLLVSRGILARLRGRLDEARALFEQAVRATDRAPNADPFARRSALANLGTVLSELGSYEEARTAYERARPPDAARSGAESDRYPVFRVKLAADLAIVDLREGKLDAARARLRAVLDGSGDDALEGPLRASLENDLAEVERLRGDYDAAAALLERALASTRAAYGDAHPATANMEHTLAQVERARAHDERADALYGAALDAARAALGERHPMVAMILYDRALLARARGDRATAIGLERQAFAIDEHLLARVLPAATELERRAYTGVLRDHLDALVDDALGSDRSDDATAAAVRALLARKGRALDVVAASQRAHEGADAAERLELSRLAFRGPPVSEDLAAWAAHVAALEQKVDAETTSRATLAPLPDDLAAQIAATLPARSLLVDVYERRPVDPRTGAFGEPRYVAVALGPRTSPRLVDLGAAAAIDAQVRALRAAWTKPSGDGAADGDAARALRRGVLDPLEVPEGTERLLVSPDGALNLVPLEALVLDDGARVLARWEVSYLTAGRDVLAPAPARAAGSILVLADPVMSNPHWPALPGTRAEAEAIAAVFPGARVETGAAATRRALDGAGGFAVVHLATHGFFLDGARYAMDGAAAVSRGFVLDDSPVVVGAYVDPLARAGVILSPARAGDDGVVSALELAAADLSRTRLVVLSACETGLGEVEVGQGVYGLRRGLVLAGARDQVISLWKVDDDATRALMTAFYGALSEGVPPAAALRRAKLSTAARGAWTQPYFWAAFIANGADAEPLRIDGARAPGRVGARASGCACREGIGGGSDAAGAVLLAGVLAVVAAAVKRRRGRRAAGGRA
jgi:tetratricopeptide (TPR) repeat protein